MTLVTATVPNFRTLVAFLDAWTPYAARTSTDDCTSYWHAAWVPPDGREQIRVQVTLRDERGVCT